MVVVLMFIFSGIFGLAVSFVSAALGAPWIVSFIILPFITGYIIGTVWPSKDWN